MVLNNLCFTISWVPSVVARFFGRCSREEPGRPHTGSMSSSHGTLPGKRLEFAFENCHLVDFPMKNMLVFHS